MAVFHVNLD